MQSIHQSVREAEQNYLTGSVKLGKYVSFSMHDVIETIDAYLNSKHTSGPTDSQGREKPFFNIVTAITNIWYRATDIDRKDIKFIPQKAGSVILAFVAGVLLQKWMDENNFGQFLNLWGRALARYGSAIVKFVERGDKLEPVVVPWNRFIPDAIDFYAIPHIEKFFKTPAQLINMATPGHPDYAYYDLDVVKELIEATSNRKTLDNQDQDTAPNFIPLYEVHGLLDDQYLAEDPEEREADDIEYTEQMHVIAFIENDGDYQDYTLFKGKEKKSPYMITHLIEEDGRTLAIGAVESSIEAQWMQNHTVKNMKDTLDLASKLIFQTADTLFTGRNVLSAIETGDILVHKVNMPLTRVANDNPSIVAAQNFLALWKNQAMESTNTPEAMRGVTMPSGTAYRQAALMVQEANSLFELMTENKGLALEQMLREHVIPHLKKQLKNKNEVVAILDSAGIRQIDSYYVPSEAAKRFNKRTMDKMMSPDFMSPSFDMSQIQPFNPQQEQAAVKDSLAPLGNKRFFKPDELDKKTWADLLSDFEWDNVRVEVTNENSDKQAVLASLSSVLQTIASNPMMLQDPNAKMVLGKILEEVGVVSPLEIQNLDTPQSPQMQQQMPQMQTSTAVPSMTG